MRIEAPTPLQTESLSYATLPLISATRWCHVALAQLLLARGANVNHRLSEAHGTALTHRRAPP